MNASPLRDPRSDFVDRYAEKQTVADFCEGRLAPGKRCLILRASRDVGVTFFLRHLEQTADRKWFATYADCRSSDPEVIFRRFFEKLEDRKLLRWRATNLFREFGEATLRLLALLFPATAWAPAAGAFAGAVIPKVATTAYSSTPSERFAKLVTSRKWQTPVLFLVDNAQEIKPQSLNILNTVYSPQYDHVRFVLSFVTDSENADGFRDFEGRLQGFGLGVHTTDFSPPDDQLVSEIAGAIGKRLDREERAELLRIAEGSVTRIIASLRGEQTQDYTLTLIEQEILRYLVVAEQPLRHDDILNLVLRSPRFATTENAVKKAIEALARKGLVVSRSDWLGDEIELLAQERRLADAISAVYNPVAADELYRYFATVAEVKSPRHSQSAYGALLYKLAKQVDPASVGKRAFELVAISLGQADFIAAEHYVNKAIGETRARSVSDIYTLLAFQISVQEYGQALETLERFGSSYWQGVRALRVIHAIALNRVRRHQDSNAEIDVLLAELVTTDEEFALLTSYKVAALLHEGRLAEARDTFEQNYSRLRLARNRGYALRNCAAVYFWGDGRDPERASAVLAEAMEVFEKQDDKFGYHTTLNNRGALTASSYPRSDSAARALPAFQQAFEALAIFGTHHLEEVGANLGIALLLAGHVERAATHLRKVSAIASFDFPRVLMESALAFAEVASDDVATARERMRQLAVNAASLPLPEAVYRANVNAAAVESAGGGNRFQHYVDAARASGFWAGTASLDRVIAAARTNALSPTTLSNYLSHDYFQYWSQNPLSIIATPVLPEQAVGNDVSG